MIGRWRPGRSGSVSQTDSVVAAAGAVVPARRYVIAINGDPQRTISSAVAGAVFRRWSQSPDVLVRGSLRDGFVWEWPGRRTRIEIVPEHCQASTTSQQARRCRRIQTPAVSVPSMNR